MQEPVHSPEHDAQAVEAVRRGDAERYRELVERHERRVYAVAWSRLGDPTLAEEATQEAFIRGYRYLKLLGEGSKFSGWITSIARNVSINLGLRNRRELDKRERWSLENAGLTEEHTRDEDDAAPTEETLRRALAELPSAHRECLVLFYLEGKSGAEAAAALGIAEPAFRVRLHRARAALREQLEQRLEGSLEKLRPTKALAPIVMAAVLSTSSAKAATAGGAAVAGIGVKAASGLAKVFGLAWLAPLLPAIGAVPGLALMWWGNRLDRRNYRNPDGFRSKLHREFFRSFIWGFPLLMLLIVFFNHAASAAWGMTGMWIFTICFVGGLTLIAGRSLAIHRNPFQVGCFVYAMIMTVGVVASAVGWIPHVLSQVPWLVANGLFVLLMRYRPARMDYSLFLRAIQGMLRRDEVRGARSEPEPEFLSPLTSHLSPSTAEQRLNRTQLLAFGRFLGSRWIAMNFLWKPGGLALQLPPVKTQFMKQIVSVWIPILPGCSFVQLGWDGTVIAHCGDTDATDASAMRGGQSFDVKKLETSVADAVADAWHEFRDGNETAAERLLGELPEGEVFKVSPRFAASTRWMQGTMAIMLLLSALLGVKMWRQDRMRMVSGRFYKPVAVSESEIRASLAELAFPINPTNKKKGLTRYGIAPPSWTNVLPPTNLFTPDAWAVMAKDVTADASSSTSGASRNANQLAVLLGSYKLTSALINHWITLADLGWTREEVREALSKPSPNLARLCSRLSEVQVSKPEGGKENYSLLDTRYAADRALCLKLSRCADAVDTRDTVATLLRHQVLTNSLPAGRRPGLDPKLLRGTFLTCGFDPIQETWQSLVILDASGALDRIDREACIQGILRFHHGKGLFGSVRNGDQLVIFGDTRDTFYAFESLRLLNALDRIEDLEQWQFCPMVSSPPATAAAKRSVTWEEIEAWVCRERFHRILRERKANPQAPVRSLLEP